MPSCNIFLGIRSTFWDSDENLLLDNVVFLVLRNGSGFLPSLSLSLSLGLWQGGGEGAGAGLLLSEAPATATRRS